MYISCIFFKEFLYFKKLPNPVQTLSYFFLFLKLFNSEQQSVCLTLLTLFITRWLMGTKSLNNRNLLCSDELEHSRKSFPIITERETEPMNLPQAIAAGWTAVGLDSPDVQAGCYITLWVGITIAWTLACIYGVVGPHNARVDL